MLASFFESGINSRTQFRIGHWVLPYRPFPAFYQFTSELNTHLFPKIAPSSTFANAFFVAPLSPPYARCSTRSFGSKIMH